MTASFPFLFLPLFSFTMWCGVSAVHLLLKVFSHMCTHPGSNADMQVEVARAHTFRARHTRLHLYRGKVSAPASAMNNWVIWLHAEIAISPHKCENITCHQRPGSWCYHVGLHMYCVCASVCSHACVTFVGFFFFSFFKKRRNLEVLGCCNEFVTFADLSHTLTV